MKKFRSLLKRISSLFLEIKTASKLWPEIFAIPMVLAIWFVSPWIIYLVDNQAATFDTGILQIYVYVLVGMIVFNGLVFAGMKFNFPVVFNFYKKDAGEAFNSLTSWQKIIILLVLYLGLFICCVCLASIMVQPTAHV